MGANENVKGVSSHELAIIGEVFASTHRSARFCRALGDRVITYYHGKQVSEYSHSQFNKKQMLADIAGAILNFHTA